MEFSSTSYIVFDTSTNASVIDIDSTNQLPGTSSVVPYSFSNDQIQLSAGFSATETTRKAMCLKPSIIVAGVQTFIAFNVPALPSGTAAEVWLHSGDGKYQSSASIISKSNGNQEFKLSAGIDNDVQSIALQPGVEYIILIAVDSSGGFITAQVVTVKNVPISTASVYISDQDLSNALLTDAFFICVALSSNTNSRMITQAKSASMNIRYYGKQRVGTAGTLTTTKYSGVNGGAVAGAVIGALLACIILIIVATAVVLVVYCFIKKRIPVNKQPEDPVFVALQEIVTPTEENTYTIPETMTSEPSADTHHQIILPEASEIVATLQEPVQRIDEDSIEKSIDVTQEPQNTLPEVGEIVATLQEHTPINEAAVTLEDEER
jgi:tetrahydromethanopterin S-methyltransferase subunit F